MNSSLYQSQQVCDKSINTMQLPNNPLLLLAPQTKKKKTVSFSPHARMKRTLHINNYTDEEIDATWYSHDEMDSIREEINRTVEHYCMEADGENKKHYCIRGLECYSSPELMQQRLANKVTSRDAVLDEQDRQEDHGIIDWEQIAQGYQAVSSHCQVTASLMGAADEKAVTRRRLNSCVSSNKKRSSSSSSSSSQQLNKSNPIRIRHSVVQLRVM